MLKKEIEKIFLLNLTGFLILLFLELFKINIIYAWIDLRVMFFLLLVNFIYLIIINNKNEYGK